MTVEQRNQLFNIEFKLRGDKVAELEGKLYILTDMELGKGIEILEPEELYLRLKMWLQNKDTAMFGEKLNIV